MQFNKYKFYTRGFNLDSIVSAILVVVIKLYLRSETMKKREG